jgi:ubiquitin thioesterase OTU1
MTQEIDIDPDAPLAQLQVSVCNVTGLLPEKQKLLTGYPPKPISVESDLLELRAALHDGDLVIVQAGEGIVRQGSTNGKYVQPTSARQILVRRAMPQDGSCLFHAAAYALRDKSRTLGPKLRQECAETVLANKDFFTPEILGRPTNEYVEWLRQPSSWGGAIELVILSFLSQTELIALDLSSGSVERIGVEQGYSTRAFLIYTGNHYDAVAMADTLSLSDERRDQVLFSATDERVVHKAVEFLNEEAAKTRR